MTDQTTTVIEEGEGSSVIVDPEASGEDLSTSSILMQATASPPQQEGPEESHGEPQNGSTVQQASFNFTNSIIGAGAIGLGGAIATSGGLISVACILAFGWLTKLSLDLVIKLSEETNSHSYEELCYKGLGRIGTWIVSICKLLYSFGCLVAYVIVVKDNFASGWKHLLFSGTEGDSAATNDRTDDNPIYQLLQNEELTTWVVSIGVILPLCLLRDMTPLASLSVVSVCSMFAIVLLVFYIFLAYPSIRQPSSGFYQDWLEIRPGVLESLGTFVFTFVSQHTVHLVYHSLQPRYRTVANFEKVSAISVGTSATVSLAVGVAVYMTFWQSTQSDIFQMYPTIWPIDVAKLLLCLTMLLTFPLPFFTCRELWVVLAIHPFCQEELGRSDSDGFLEGDDDFSVERATNSLIESDLQEPLLASDDEDEEQGHDNDGDHSMMTEISQIMQVVIRPRHWLLPTDRRQLLLPGHVSLTVVLWFVTTWLAIAAPSLGDVLDLVGCASGTMIAFLLPALLSFQFNGYTHLSAVLLLVGVSVGVVGTYVSVGKLAYDLEH